MEVPRPVALSVRLPPELAGCLPRGEHALPPACQACVVSEALFVVQSWTAVGSLCIAPGSYDGICSPAMDFGAYTREEKLQWSTMCGPAWCEPPACFRQSLRCSVVVVQAV